MSFKDALAKARAARPEPTLVGVAVGDELYNVEVVRLDGMDWAGIVAECPISDPAQAKLGFDANKAALLACRRHSRLLGDDGEPVEMIFTRDKAGAVTEDSWADLFTTLSGDEVRGLAATWWAMNVLDPNQRVAELKKASAGGGKTS